MHFVISPSAGCFKAVSWRNRNITAPRSTEISSVSTSSFLSDFQSKCATPLPVLKQVADAMESDLRSGISTVAGASLPMLPSYVDSLPSGNETGIFYALDLGGTNFRVLRVLLRGKEKRVVDTEYDVVTIPQELMLGTTEELFDFIASRLALFVEKEGDRFQIPKGNIKREIGFTFSFPVRQTSIDSGILIKWTKGFKVSGTAGRDVVACLNEAMERRKLDMCVSALVNDTVSTIAGAHYWDNDVMIAVILGTGTNACYIEDISANPKLRHSNSTSEKTIINTEWGAFSSNLPLTVFDKDMDIASINPGNRHVPWEIVRRVLLCMAETTELFGDSIPEKLTTPFSLKTPDLWTMQQDNSDELTVVESILEESLGVYNPSLHSKKVVVEVCNSIVTRGGRLAGAGIVGILQKLNEDSKGAVLKKRIVVAMDGGLYVKHPHYRIHIEDAVSELLGPEISNNVVIEHSKDGSGIGAALLAASNSKYN